MRLDQRKIEVEPGIEVSSIWAFPTPFAAGTSPGLILAHGAGSDMRSPFLSFMQSALADRGVLTVKFNFPYREAGRQAPDPPQRLVQTWGAVVRRVLVDASPGPLFLGGRSMGGRIASMLAAGGEAAAGLILLGYPLQPAGRPDVVRAEHLARIKCPMLFVQGTRDRLCDLRLLRPLLQNLPAPTRLHVIEEGDHSFKVPKRLGKTEQQVWGDIVAVVASWLWATAPALGTASPTGHALR